MAGSDPSEAASPARLTRLAEQALGHYDLPPGSRVGLLDLSENATFRVDEPDGAASVLRLHRLGYHSPAAVASELRWLAALREQAGIRTPRVRPTRSGDPIAVLTPDDGGPARMAVRFEFLPGSEPSAQRMPEHFATLGAITARMHRHARGWARPPGFTRFRWDLDAAFGPLARWGNWRDGPGLDAPTRAVLHRLEQALTRRLTAYGSGPRRWGLIHADLRLANLLMDDDGAISVIDFDDCGEGWYLYDLATAVSFFEHAPEVPELVDRWLAGYRTVEPLDAADEAEIWTFILFRRLLLVAWIGSHTAVEFARSLGAGYVAESAELAERYLSRTRPG